MAIINASSNGNFEHGYGLFNRGDFQTYGSYAGYVAGVENRHVNFTGSSYMFGTVHNHPYNSDEIPMFSHDDIYTLLLVKNQYAFTGIYNPNGDATFVSVLAVKQGVDIHTYAIKIEDPTKLLNLNNYKASNRKWRKFGEKLQDLYMKKANGKNGSPTQYQKTFLQFLKDKDLGVSLYKMKPNDVSDPDNLETWEKLTLNNDGTLSNPIPCN